MTNNQHEAYDAMIADRDQWRQKAERMENLCPSDATACSASPSDLLPPREIIEAAATVAMWMDKMGYKNWQLGGVCDRRFAIFAGRAEARLDTVHQLSVNALQTSWLYSGKGHVEKLMREIAAISGDNEPSPSVGATEKAK